MHLARVWKATRAEVGARDGDERERPGGALAFLAGELAPQRDADDEPLRPVGQVVQVDDGDLGAGGGDGPLAAVRQVAADDRVERLDRRAEPAQQGVDAAGDRAPSDPAISAGSAPC